MSNLPIGRLDEAEPFTTKDGSTIREVAGRVSLRDREPVAGPGHRARRDVHRRALPPASARRSTTSPRAAGGCALATARATSRAGDTIVIAPGVEHKLWASPDEDLVLLCCCAPAYRNEDTVITE